MRRLGWWLHNGFTILSLLLFVATVVMWVRSEFDSGYVMSGTPTHWSVINASRNSIPYFTLSLSFAFFAALGSAPYIKRRSRRRMEGLCLNCSYNLTGNLSGTCPECGTTRGVN